MIKFVWLLWVLASLVQHAVATCCPPNEVFSLCGNNGCQNTCANPNIAKVCKGPCVPGCVCIGGYLRNGDGECVPYKKCDTCGENEVFDLCGNTDCINTCDQPDYVANCTSAGCNAGCICRKGYLRNSEHQCVKPKRCGCGGDRNAVFDINGDTCPTTCENFGKPRYCVAVLPEEGGCRCKKGFVRDYKQKCIKPSECHKCNANEYFGCGSPCDTTCATLGEPCPITKKKCTKMCYCKDGFARDANGVCVPEDQCPSRQCPDDPNAITLPCGDPCPLTCANKDDPLIAPCIAICIINGCKCKDGYVKDDTGKCILAAECPITSNTATTGCPINEIQSACKSNPCENTCANPNISIGCTSVCTPGCACVEGYIRNTQGTCVLPCDCDTCNENEIFDLCGNHECVDTCIAPNRSTTCLPSGCIPGCICKQGYLRNQKHQCVLAEQCHVGCNGDPNAILDPMGNPCPITCENKDVAIRICSNIPPLVAACRCLEGYVEDHNERCILPSDCRTCDGPNEFFSCGSACDTTCATLGETCPIVNIKCTEMCYCREGYARDENGICISVDECPTRICKNDPNAIITPCGDPCPVTCENKHTPMLTPCPEICIVNGCKCKEGYVIGADGKCILESKCPLKCKENEIFSECGNNQCQNTCANPRISLFCKPMCVSGCICVEGYLRNSYGECVIATECDSCPENEKFDLCGGTSCVNTCGEPDKTTRCTPSGCKPGCICKDGFLRNSKYKCVPADQCETSCGGDPNAVFDPCGDPCPITCLNKDKNFKCPRLCSKRGGCKCKRGYVRDIYGKCILPDQCPACTGKHEFFACGSPCDTTCDTLGEKCNIIKGACTPMCYCEKGYARDSEEKCIPIDQCPPKQCKDDPNAIIVPCGDPCPLTCENKDNPLPLPCPKICIIDGCKCNDGYVLGNDGKCILPTECPAPEPIVEIKKENSCSENEVYSRCRNNACQNTCRNPNIAKYCLPHCIPGCVCAEGYLRNTEGICVPPSECDTCRKNETFDLCGNTKCVDTCAEPDLSTRCKPKGCHAGCICKEGYLRNRNFECVKPEDCKCGCGGDVNAMFDPFGDSCPITCFNMDNELNCTVKSIKGGCKCKPGFVRDFKGLCILPIECPKPRGENEFYACGSPCDRTCANLGEPCLIIAKKCTEMFYCKKGYARNGDGICIPIDQCPPKQCKSDPNAIILPCGDPCPETCENKDLGPRPCPMICIPNGCKCKEGYVLGKDGKCILLEDCPKCTGENEYFGCASPCDRKCATLGEPCPIFAKKCTEMCYCKKGYARDDEGNCIPIDQCPPKQCKSDPNAILLPCGDPCPVTCENKDLGPRPCPKICIPNGCKCKEGYVLGKDGKCILLEDCPKCTGENEYFSCGSPCDRKCATLGEPCPIFAKKCTEMCYCKKGFARDDEGNCIPLDQCPPKQCKTDPNAIILPCGDPCPATCENRDLGPRPCPTVCIPNGCKCKEGYVLGKDGKCILSEECPKCTGDNEFFGCGPPCDRICATLGEPCPIITKKCTEMCYCRRGYARDVEGNCIPIFKCPPKQCKTDPNAIVLPCGDPCPETCENKDSGPRICPKICIRNGCKCKEGFVLGKDGKCIQPEECPIPLVCKENEEYVECPPSCPPEKSCSSLFTGLVPLCPTTINQTCTPSCRCKSGYIRSNGGRCILPKECCKDPYSELVECPNPCPGGTCSQPEYSQCNIKCAKYGCQCKKGFVKIANSEPYCVPLKYCDQFLKELRCRRKQTEAV